MKRTVFHILMVLTVALVLMLSPTFCSLGNNVLITNTGKISTTTVTAKSGSIDDLQAAINIVHAQGNGTVIIPAGTFVFNPNGSVVRAGNYRPGVISYGGINIVGAGTGQTILKETQDPNGTNIAMLEVDGTNGWPYTVSGIKFQGHVSSEDASSIGLIAWGSTDYRITNCWFDSFPAQGILAVCDNRGVIDHCNFTNTYKNNPPPSGSWWWGYGIIVVDQDYTAWSSDASIVGQYYGARDIVYIENCWFDQCRHAISVAQNGYYVARFNTVTNEVPFNFGCFDVHGFNYGRGAEIYNNTVYGNGTGQQAVWLRGGTNTVFNNIFINCAYGVQLFNESSQPSGVPPYNDVVNNTYIWSNTMVGGGTAFADESGTYVQNVNYFLYTRPGYTTFVYPHPLALQGVP